MTRYQSLDVLRGLTVALMIIVNTPGDWSTNFSPLLHASWHGLTITDLVFPSFLFVVGNAMSFSLSKLQDKGPGKYFQKVMKRTIIIFVIGLLLTAFPFFRLSDAGIIPFDFTKIRVLGVLQRIALCYGIAATLIYFFKLKGSLIIGACMLIGYWFLMYFFGAPGADPYALEGNAARKLDLWLIGTANLYRGEGIPFDPEGVLSTIPAVVNVLLGYAIGVWVQREGGKVKTVFTLLLLASGLLFLGYLWDVWFPINKKIWTSSFVLVSVGYATILLACLMYVLEVLKWKKWAYFFEVFGKNPLILYVLSGVLVRIMLMVKVGDQAFKSWAYQGLFVPYFPPKAASLVFAICFMLLIWLVGWWMDKNKWYIKV
ncbi:MAG: heparan-alpha-glucosaminide N-acetyltransferase domain-containing protein [Cyclobacterium sp.]|uniref:acyltransferase family protein n=1 Tax=Cyclobacterium sp. TaxID=1966343 RepID=UPI003970B149